MKEFTYLGKHFLCVNANWYFGKCRNKTTKRFFSSFDILGG